jgi:ABC-type spermidine/putrescine transport system permease subunit I
MYLWYIKYMTGCTKAIKYLFTINNLTRFAQHVDTISKMDSVFITSEMSIRVPQTIHSTIYSHTLKFSFPVQLICFLCGTWYHISNTDTKGNHRTNTLNYSYTVRSILQSMLIALCNKIQILSQKGESI